jgi:hypothetical protein
MTISQGVVDELLVSGLTDWVMLVEVRNAVWKQQFPSLDGDEVETRLYDPVIDTIRTMVENGFVDIGDLTGDDGFSAWSLPLDEALLAVKRAWLSLSEDLSLNDVCWLANTSKGDAVGEQILQSWKGHFGQLPFDPMLWTENDRFGLNVGRVSL